ncbi:MAG: MCE family protein [Candidatus Kapabacteria bacterium]|nr:MCE family protein [Candidatus Kapabacteria bacterium]
MHLNTTANKSVSNPPAPPLASYCGKAQSAAAQVFLRYASNKYSHGDSRRRAMKQAAVRNFALTSYNPNRTMQRNQRTTEIRVGIITVLAVLILIVGVSLGRGFSVSPAQKTIAMRFTTVNGIDPSAPVWINGVKRGSVASVKPDGNSVVVTAILDNTDDLRADARARITILELTGGKRVDIMNGTSAQAWNGGEIKGESTPDFGDVLALVGEVGGDAKSLVRRLDSISAHINILLADGSFIKNVKELGENANKSVATLNAIVQSNRDNLQTAITNLRSLSDDLRRIVKENEPGITSLIAKLDRTAGSAEKIIGSADSTLTRVNTLVANVDGVVKDVRSGEGSIGKLIYDKGLAVKLDSTMANLQVFIDQVSKHGVNVNLRLGTRP